MIWPAGLELTGTVQNSTPPVAGVPSSTVEVASKLEPVTVTVAPAVLIEPGLRLVTSGGGFATTVKAPTMLPWPLTGSITCTSYGPPVAMPGQSLAVAPLGAPNEVPLQTGTTAVMVCESTKATPRMGMPCVVPGVAASGARMLTLGSAPLKPFVAGAEKTLVMVTGVS